MSENKNGYLYKKRWKMKNRKKVNEQKKRNYDKGSVGTLSEVGLLNIRWTEEDDRIIINANRPKDRVLSKILRRSVRGIQIRRYRVINNVKQ